MLKGMQERVVLVGRKPRNRPRKWWKVTTMKRVKVK